MATISFGPYAFDPASGLTDGSGKPVGINQRGQSILGVLLQAQGQVVTKTELIERAWPGLIVEEGNLTVQIAALRKALGEGPDGREWIITVPRVGYRLIVSRALPEHNETTKAEPSLSCEPKLAVLAFLTLSGDPEQEYFADGIADDIITALSRFKSFAVIARNSSFAFKGRAVDVRQVAKDLGVRYVLEGSVRRAGGKLRITAQLVDGATGANLWAKNFDGALDEVFEFQDRITESVATVVEPQIQAAELEHSRRERPGSIAAYDLYLRALSKHRTSKPEDNATAYALLTEASRLEPENGVFLAYAAAALDHRITMGAAPIGADDWERREDLARRGLEHAGNDATVMGNCGAALMNGRDYDLALATVQRAVETNPNNLYVLMVAGVANIHCGSVEDALTYLHRALKLSPGDPDQRFALTGIAHCHMVLEELTQAIGWAERSLSINAQYPATYWMLTAAHAKLGHVEQARRYLIGLRRLVPGATIKGIRAGQPDKDPNRMAAILEGLRLAGLE